MRVLERASTLASCRRVRSSRMLRSTTRCRWAPWSWCPVLYASQYDSEVSLGTVELVPGFGISCRCC